MMKEGESMQTQDAEIVFTSTIDDPSDPGNRQTIAQVIQGKIGKSGSSLYLVFSAEIADVGLADYTIRVGNEEALILRKGALPMRQQLVIGQSIKGSYESQFGRMETQATAKRIETTCDPAGRCGSVHLVYELLIQEQSVGKATMEYRYLIK
ncbi:DUF1934 domain-containing protein [Sporolactobacillus inulinus]|uniref:DUF1934 domain-containing protein n=2 Tax=Sporolactobacillus inulinus TaxID=2078 RepID=A0A4Y1Z6S9_9BACL|nr:DUF1934 domain-containing protein [Sporolactobacillus inulinus]